MSATYLPYGRQQIDENDIAAVVEVLRGDWLTTGPTVAAFEAALAEKVGARHVIVCSSGTAALHLAVLALGLGPEDAVVVPTLTLLASANAARYVGAEVIFADIDPETGLMGETELAAALARAGNRRVRTTIPVHYAGQCADAPRLAAFAADKDLTIVEDAAHSIGTTYRHDSEEHRVGSARHSAMSILSFHPVKTITLGEGGAVCTEDDKLAERLRRLRNHGIERRADRFVSKDIAFDARGQANPWYYEMAEPGFNYRATDLQCALGLSQLRRLDEFVARRRMLAERYDALLAPLAPLVRPLGRIAGCTPAWHLYVVRIDFAQIGIDRAEVVRRLAARGIGTQVHYIPVHLQPYYRRREPALRLPGAEALYEQILSLPLYPAMSDSDPDRVVASLVDVVRRS
jgi:UDP-4-amino-4,6-dideoxy-N-acetyl-beta-L-altrosamine transaminase